MSFFFFGTPWYKEVSVTICKDSQITVLRMVKIVMFLSI